MIPDWDDPRNTPEAHRAFLDWCVNKWGKFTLFEDKPTNFCFVADHCYEEAKTLLENKSYPFTEDSGVEYIIVVTA